MFKRAIKGIVIGAAALGMFAGQAAAADYDINIYGASAQHKFWLNLAPDYLANEAGCDTVNQYAYNKKHGMAIGENCDIPASGDQIIIRYSSRASYDGINAVSAGATRSMCNAGDNCATLAATAVNLGASDVAGLSFQTRTQGWEDGNQSFPGPLYYANSGTLNFPTEATMEGLEEFNPIVVPFGFLINNSVTEYRCAKPVVPVDSTAVDHKAFDKNGWSCVPESLYACSNTSYTNQVDCEDAGATWALTGTTTAGQSGVSTDCIGFYKCLGYVAGYCSDDSYDNQEDCEAASATWTPEVKGTCNGGTKSGQSCDEADDCPDVVLADTYCKEVPVNNLSQTMAQRIFSGKATNWADFGPSYVAQSIVRCMRHSGSGTHATMNLAVMDGQELITGSVPNVTWHFTSSSDLTKCVTDFAGAVGYVDVDKLLTFEEIGEVAGAHIAKYNGADPVRRNIVDGVYEFWAAQHVYYRAADFEDGEPITDILDSMIAYSSDPANLTTATLSNAAYFWAAQSEMNVSRDVDGGPIF